MLNLFILATNFDQPLGDWDVSNVQGMDAMFASNSFNQDISKWDVSNVQLMRGIFGRNTAFNQDLSGWNVASVTDNTQYDDGADAWEERYKPKFKP